MKQVAGNHNQKRGRPRVPQRRGGPNRNNFDSNGPGVRIRGNAAQIQEKYLQLARDALGSGERILAENMMQHAEHYYRLAHADEQDRAAPSPRTAPQQPPHHRAPQRPAEDFPHRGVSMDRSNGRGDGRSAGRNIGTPDAAAPTPGPAPGSAPALSLSGSDDPTP